MNSNYLMCFVRNIKFLFKYNLSNEFVHKKDLNSYLDNLYYELSDKNFSVKKPIIINPYKTINEIIDKKISISRFGDGEFELMFNRSIPFQKFDIKLQKRLLSIIQSQKPNIGICIPYFYWNEIFNYNNRVKNFIRKEFAPFRKEYESVINFENNYYATEFTQINMAMGDYVDLDKYYSTVKKIWDNRKIVLVHGEKIFNELEYNIFENAHSIQHVVAPSINAFEKYDSVLKEILKFDKDCLIVIILGPTATVLAYDLSIHGYQALDFGHIAKDYDFYKKKILKTEENLNKFLQPD